MSKMSELEITIIELLGQGYACTDIAQELEVPLIWVEDLMNDWYEELA